MNNQYTEECCRHAWDQLCRPTLNPSNVWSQEEDELLMKIVDEHGAYGDQWSVIASYLVIL